mmetsp:Transcript_18845/g.52640  ORF Transcript_18845/g.52640 Transcript_18845/m.52640 type:complete len:258 (-) Transcript_18845:94-867(-)
MLSNFILPIEMNRAVNRTSSSPNHLNISALVSAASSKKRPRREEPVAVFDKNQSPSDYTRLAFLANGLKDFESITKDCESRFLPITTAMLEAYHTEILTAVRSNDLEKAQQLYREGQFQHGTNACNRFGESILHIACRRGNLGMVRFLVEEVGLSIITIRDDYHRTPLHDAFWTSKASYEVVEYLLNQPYVTELLLCKDKRGFTPLDYSRVEDRSKWLTFMWERRATLRPYESSQIKREHECPSEEESPRKRIRMIA